MYSKARECQRYCTYVICSVHKTYASEITQAFTVISFSNGPAVTYDRRSVSGLGAVIVHRRNVIMMRETKKNAPLVPYKISKLCHKSHKTHKTHTVCNRLL